MVVITFKDLRGFLQKLEEENCLLRIEDEVNPEPDIGAMGAASKSLPEGEPALLFNNIRGYEKGKCRVAVGVHGSWQNLNLLFDLPKEAREEDLVIGTFPDLQNERIKPEQIPPDEAACKENIVTGDRIDLPNLIPFYRNNLQDAGPYITKGVVVSRDPIEGWENLGIYRMQLKGKRKLGVQLLPIHNSGRHFVNAMKTGEPLEIAVAIGSNPVLPIVASSPNPPGTDDYAMAGGIMGEPVEVTEAETSDLPVPAHAEIIIEGKVDPYTREIEGPMGEFTGYYSPYKKLPVMEVEAVTFRDSPIFDNLVPGKPVPFGEMEYIQALNTSATLYNQLRSTYPNVRAVNASYCHGLIAVISMRPDWGGQGKTAAMNLMSTPHGQSYIKLVIVVDEDIDPFDWDQIAWSLSTRLHPERGVAIIEHCPGMTLDPAFKTYGEGFMDKMIIDLTKPAGEEPPFEGVEHENRPEVEEYVEEIERRLREGKE